MTVAHGPVVIRRRLGHVLKQLRVGRGKQLSEIAKLLEVSPSKLSRIETGHVEPKFRDVRSLLDLYEAGTEVQDQVLNWANEAKSPGWWQPFSVRVTVDLDLYISLESEARSVLIHSTPISGLLQTEQYAREMLRGAYPDMTEEEVTTLVDLRMGRQRVVAPDRSDSRPLDLHAVLDESALHRIPGSPATMRDQLRELVTRSRQPNIVVQILPFSAGYTSVTSTFAIFEPLSDQDWTVVNVEGTGLDTYFDTPAEVQRYRAFWDDVLASSLDPEASRAYIENLIDRS
ncbi:helix-turn-helix domain-containing protein [Pseudonocardia parietis]|uniref:Transcriptional regulator with XRE-family HTH domain n=1 Tax=Pseudonocardia parietis TaxID=570936 RepID=A0ABS4VKQ4_9PSEU|nr:helix-turn-helix transcriptional regulator [Pseudonocardia parietis]MBP2364505.1 transcriptional regulator with XRE-family HTH domain [Pseudonocardia parietis]